MPPIPDLPLVGSASTIYIPTLTLHNQISLGSHWSFSCHLPFHCDEVISTWDLLISFCALLSTIVPTSLLHPGYYFVQPRQISDITLGPRKEWNLNSKNYPQFRRRLCSQKKEKKERPPLSCLFLCFGFVGFFCFLFFSFFCSCCLVNNLQKQIFLPTGYTRFITGSQG